MTHAPDGTITWTLERLYPPGMRATWWQAEAACPHGASRHQLVASSLDLIRAQLAALCLLHQMKIGCTCPGSDLVVEGEGLG